MALAAQPAAAFAQTTAQSHPNRPHRTRPATHRADTLSPDSLAARLARAEAAIAALRQQIATESQTTVHTRSRLQLDLTGMIITNAFYTHGRATSIDVPLVALAPTDVAESNAFGATVRQTRLGGVVTRDRRSSAEASSATWTSTSSAACRTARATGASSPSHVSAPRRRAALVAHRV